MCRQHPKAQTDTTMKCGKQCMTVGYARFSEKRVSQMVNVYGLERQNLYLRGTFIPV